MTNASSRPNIVHRPHHGLTTIEYFAYIFKRKLEGAETSFNNETEWIITRNVLRNLEIEISNKTSSQVLEIVRAVYKKGKFSDMEEFEEEVMNNIEKEDIEI